jgi:hypothetical protein
MQSLQLGAVARTRPTPGKLLNRVATRHAMRAGWGQYKGKEEEDAGYPAGAVSPAFTLPCGPGSNAETPLVDASDGPRGQCEICATFVVSRLATTAITSLVKQLGAWCTWRD